MGDRGLTDTVALRRATNADADLLLDWANDPATRAASFRPGRIDPATHGRWLAERVASPTTRLFIGLVDGVPIGQVRLEGDADGYAEVGIAVAPERRGAGIGPHLLAAGLAAGRRDADLHVVRFVARVRPENGASVRLFEGAGFRLLGRETCSDSPCLVYLLEA